MGNGTITCPHCGAVSAAGAFCESCGKAVPSTFATSPRIVSGDALPYSAAGQKLVGDELRKHTNRAAYTLLAVGILQVTCGPIVAVTLANAPGVGLEGMVGVLLVAQFVVAAVFFGLYFWARTAPLPASIVGLAIYVTLVLINMATSLSSLSEGGPRRGFGGCGIGLLDIIIIVLLAQGIQAGLKHKRLMETPPSM
jgi:hypothetical protein